LLHVALGVVRAGNENQLDKNSLLCGVQDE
jgi:hypothetical protein